LSVTTRDAKRKQAQMKAHDLSSLVRDERQQNLYDMFAATFVNTGGALEEYVVGPEDEMRIDLICHKIYQNTNQIDLILNINGIVNPLNIMAGDVIKYPSETNLEEYKVSPAKAPSQANAMITPNRANIKDPRRQEFVENNYQLPPTMLPSPVSPIVVGRNEIFIKPIR
jgi:hypothetical protein